MKRILIFIPLIFIVIVGCYTNINEPANFNEYGLSLSCPCELERDTLKERKVKESIGNNIISYICVDSNNFDTYHIDILLNKSDAYSDKEILTAIDSTLKTKNIEHERSLVSGKESMVIDYIRAKEIEIFSDLVNYYLLLEATDSLDKKFNTWTSTVKIY